MGESHWPFADVISWTENLSLLPPNCEITEIHLQNVRSCKKPVMFLHTNNELTEQEIKETTLLTIAAQQKESKTSLGVDLNRDGETRTVEAIGHR